MTNLLYIESSTQDYIDPTLGDVAFLNWISPNTFSFQDPQQQVITITPGTPNPSATPFPTFPDKATAIAYYQAAICSQMLSDVNAFYGVSFYTGYDVESVPSGVNAAIASINTNISGKSNKSSFSAVTALAAHGIANASAASNPGLPTNFNLVSGVLGIANGLNDANTAQNDLATKYNDLEAKFNSCLAWLGTNKDTINALKTAGAA